MRFIQNNLEETIYRAETNYLEETTAGNIVKGFDNYIKGAVAGTTGSIGGANAARRKAPISDQDRIFSRSSHSFMANVSLRLRYLGAVWLGHLGSWPPTVDL